MRSELMTELFGCPSCRTPLDLSPDGRRSTCGTCGFTLEKRGAIWANPGMSDGQPDNYCENIDYVARSRNPATTTARETVQYNKVLGEIVQSLGIRRTVLDAGCGDGRFTRYLLSLGVERVVSLDIDSQNLERLASRLSKEELERSVLLQGDLLRLPLLNGHVDAVFAMGVLNVLVDRFTDVCSQFRQVLAKGGYLINSDATLEGSLLYALVRHDFEEFFEVAETHTKAIDYDGDRNHRYAVFEDGRVESLLRESGFVVESKRGISVLPSLIFGGVLQTAKFDDHLKQRLVDVVDRLAARTIPVYRVFIYLSRSC